MTVFVAHPISSPNSPPVGLDSSATITIGDRQFRVDASDLESLARLGSGAYGVVEKMRHKESDTIMAVKVLAFETSFVTFCRSDADVVIDVIDVYSHISTCTYLHTKSILHSSRLGH